MIVAVICREDGAAAARLLTCDVAVEELLPQLVGLRIERVDAGPAALRITAFTRDDGPRHCPGCGHVSDWTHSRYVRHVAVALAGSAGARLLTVLHRTLSSVSVLNCLMRIALPDRPPPLVAGIDEFALFKGHRCATITIDADSGQRVEVLPDRKAATVPAWLREHPGVRVVGRDGSGAFA